MTPALVVAALALGLAPGATGEPAESSPPAGPPCQGIVVVVDAGDLPGVDGAGAGTVSCAPRDGATTEPSDGLEVLRDAGVQVEGTAQWGAAFVCRVDGRPAPSEEILLPGGAVVREPCERTPSTEAYWSLWTAAPGDGSAWTYAQTGVKDMDLVPGAALGLVFSVGPAAPAAPTVSAADARAGRAGEDWTVRPSAEDEAAPADDAAAATQGQSRDGDPLLLGAAVALVLVLGGASVALARRRR